MPIPVLTARERELLEMLETVLQAAEKGDDLPWDQAAEVVSKFRGYSIRL
jgi:hypothetical protein